MTALPIQYREYREYQLSTLWQWLTDGSVVYSVAAQKISSALPMPSMRKLLSHGLTALLMAISISGFYQLGNIALSETNNQRPSPAAPSVQAAALAPVSSRPSASLTKSAPNRLEIPSINVDASFSAVSQKADGTLGVPPAELAGWYTGAPTPGEIGPAIVVGHLDSIAGPAIFYNLKNLRPGDDIRITREDGRIVTFRVERSLSYPQDDFPSQAVYGNIDYAGLRLITCDGSFNQITRSYSHNLVVYARMVPG